MSESKAEFDQPRHLAWAEFRDGPNYTPTDRYPVRDAFDAGWTLAHQMGRAGVTAALRYAQAQAVTERARGRADEERAWLDMCALLTTPPASEEGSR